MGTPYAAVIGVLLALIVLAFVVGEDEQAPVGPPTAPIAVIAERVETLRSLRFKELPQPERVSAAQAAREGLADFDRAYPEEQREAEEAVYEMVGLLPEGTDLRKLSETIFTEQIAGYYDPRDGRLRIVEGPGSGDRVVDETTIAHELVHALEDQVFDLDVEAAETPGDPGYAYTALLEGTATVAMIDYLDRHFRAEEALAGLLGSAFSLGSTEPLPPFVMASLVFPYEKGAAFVEELRRVGQGSWKLVDLALRVRPPVSTEQVLHPEKWVRAEPPLPVEVESPGAGWEVWTEGTFGEWQTGQLIDSARAAVGWGGDHYALFRRGDERRLVIRWRWETARDAREFAEAFGKRAGARLEVRGREATATFSARG